MRRLVLKVFLLSPLASLAPLEECQLQFPASLSFGKFCDLCLKVVHRKSKRHYQADKGSIFNICVAICNNRVGYL